MRGFEGVRRGNQQGLSPAGGTEDDSRFQHCHCPSGTASKEEEQAGVLGRGGGSPPLQTLFFSDG